MATRSENRGGSTPSCGDTLRVSTRACFTLLTLILRERGIYSGKIRRLKPALRITSRYLVAQYYKDILVGLVLLASPFLLFPRGYGLLALLVLPIIWLLRWILVGRIVPRTPLDWPILVILVMVLTSIWTTFDLSFSIGKIAGVLLGIIVYYAIVDLADTRSSLQTVIAFFILCGTGIAIVSALGTRWTDKFPLIDLFLSQLPRILRDVRQAEEGFHPNQVGGILIFFIPLQLVLLGYWLNGKPNGFLKATLAGISLAITTGVLLLTQSRGALGGLIVGLATIAAIRTRWGKVLALLGFIVILAATSSGIVDELMTLGVKTETVGTISLAARLEIWSRGWQGLIDFPLGMGMNTFRRVMPILYPTVLISPTTDVAHAHNHLLQAGLDLGIPGLIAYLALWSGAGFLLFQVMLRSGTRFYRVLALGLVGSFTAHFIYGMTDAVALGAKPGFVFWWALGLVVAIYNLFLSESDKSVVQ